MIEQRRLPRALAPVAAVLMAVALVAPSPAWARAADLPPIAQRAAVAMVEACIDAGGRPRNPMDAIERIDLDDDGTPDVILDENRFVCDVRPFGHCQAAGCQTAIFLSKSGDWRPSLGLTGSYCIEYGATPPRFVTIQRNFDIAGGMEIINVRYRFRRGLYFQDGRGAC